MNGYSSNHLSTKDSAVAEGLDFILTHFEEPIWPRTIFTRTLGKQLVVYNKQEALARFKQSNFLDCRINAYNPHIEYKGINRQPPNFIFIDLDRSNFKTQRAHKMALNSTLKNMRKKLCGNPTVLWSGNGYHIYQPIQASSLEQEEMFSKFEQPSKAFLKFAAQNLSNNKSDPNNNPSFRSCLVRIPYTYNFKRVQLNKSIANSCTEVKVIQTWDLIRSKSNPLLYYFNIWLIDNEIKEINGKLKQKKTSRRYINHSSSNNNTQPWIEKLLQTPIEDYRKNTVSLILAPYLMTIKTLHYQDAFEVIKQWLDRCNSLKHNRFIVLS